MSPKAFASQKTTQQTTTTFKMDLMDDAMGMKRFTSHSRIHHHNQYSEQLQ